MNYFDCNVAYRTFLEDFSTEKYVYVCYDAMKAIEMKPVYILPRSSDVNQVVIHSFFSTSVELESQNVCVCVCVCVREGILHIDEFDDYTVWSGMWVGG